MTNITSVTTYGTTLHINCQEESFKCQNKNRFAWIKIWLSQLRCRINSKHSEMSLIRHAMLKEIKQDYNGWSY